MSECVVIVANGFTHGNVRLQPWRYLYEIAKRLGTGKTVVVVTEGAGDADEELWSEGFRVVQSRYLSVRQQPALARLIRSYEPKQLWWSVTPRTIAYWKLLKTISCEKFALITCPLYSYLQLTKASLAGVPFHELGALWQQRVVPRTLFAHMLRGNVFRKVFVQSHANASILVDAGVQRSKLSVLPVGIDAADREPISCDVVEEEKKRLGFGESTVTLLYFGAIRKIRGFDALLCAFSRAAGKLAHVQLVVLARGADELLLAEVNRKLARFDLLNKVSVIGGWLSREQVWAHIELSDVVVLPFVIVPSDVPIAVLESMARGKPVIGSPVDGIPELISGRGVVVDPLNTGSFARSMLSLINNRDERENLGRNARNFMRSYPDWDEIGARLVREVGRA